MSDTEKIQKLKQMLEDAIKVFNGLKLKSSEMTNELQDVNNRIQAQNGGIQALNTAISILEEPAATEKK